MRVPRGTTHGCSFFCDSGLRAVEPQCDAVAAAVVDDAKELFDRTPIRRGGDGGWTCIDFGDVIVNVMTPRPEFYNIDEIWKNAEQVDLSGCLRRTVAGRRGHDDDEDDDRTRRTRPTRGDGATEVVSATRSGAGRRGPKF